MSTEAIESHLYVLPWIQLPEPVVFGDVIVAHIWSCVDRTDRLATAAHKILAVYQGLGGAALEPCLMWLADRQPLTMESSDLNALLLHRMCMASGLIMNNAYYSDSGIGPICDAHFAGYFHRFSDDTDHVGIYKRRREGYYLDGWPLEKIKMSEPLSASSQHQAVVDEDLFDTLVSTIKSGSDLGQTLQRALPPFLQANHLYDETTTLDDLVWMGAAFERLFAVSEDIGSALSRRVVELFSGAPHGSTDWVHISRSGNEHPESGSWCQRWMREFYARRSAIHSGSAPSGTWNDDIHSVIAAEVFSLSVKRLLDEAGDRPLSNDDQVAMDSLDARIEAMASRPGDLFVAWRAPFEKAGRHRVVTRIAQELKGEPSVGPDSVGMPPE